MASRPRPGPEPASGTEGPGPASPWPPGFARDPPDRSALQVLLGLTSISPRRLAQLAREQGTASACLTAVLAGQVGSEADRRRAGEADPERVARRLQATGARFVAAGDPEFPPELLELPDPPAGLFVRGQGLRVRPRVAIVGARNGTPNGREMAAALAAALAGAGASVVSGGARGIDAAAHRGALEAGGVTVCVLGCGIDVPYPRQNARLLERIAREGAVLSEYPPGTPPGPHRFPARNRLVAALSRAVVVVEGGPGSGSMITADHALELGRDVFAVPGPPDSELSAAPHALIREGATLIRGPEDLLADLGLEPRVGREAASRRWPSSSPTSPGDRLPGVAGDAEADGAPERTGPGAGGPTDRDGLSEAEHAVWNALRGPSPPDRLAADTGLPLPEVLSALVGLELRGLVLETGGRYRRRPGPPG